MQGILNKFIAVFKGFTTFSVVLKFGEEIYKFHPITSLNRDWSEVNKDLRSAMKKFEAKHERKKKL